MKLTVKLKTSIIIELTPDKNDWLSASEDSKKTYI